MGATVTEKILAAHAGLSSVRPNQIVTCRVDLVMANDFSGPPAYAALRRLGIEKVFDPGKVALVPSHFAPAKDSAAAIQLELLRRMAGEQGIEHFWEVGRMGIEHAILPDQGLIAPGELIVGGDSHSTTYGALGAFSTGVGNTDVAAALALGEVWLRVPETMRFILRGKPRRWVTGKDVILSVIGRIGVDGARYRAMEYAGEGLRHLSMADRLSVANMTVEAGGKNGIMPVDDVARAYLAGRVARPYVAYESDVDAEFHSVMDVDLDSLPPLVAAPFSPANSMPAAEARGVKVTQVFIGSCTNGLLPDLRQAAGILRGRKLAPGVRMIVTPASQEVYLAALREGLIETFIELGAAVSTPGCGACAGVHTGVLGPDDVCVSTTNRNFHGRMGHFDSRTYLANAYVAAASAVAGEIVDPAAVCGIGPGEPLP